MEKVIELVRVDFSDLFGVGDIYLKLIEETLSVSIFLRGNLIKIKGRKKQISQAKEALSEMVNSIEGKGNLTTNDVEKILALISIEDPKKTFKIKDVVFYGQKGAVEAKNNGQRKYLDQLIKHDIVFSVGPAGTGKTFLAVAFAVAALERNEIDRIILCRPAVEAGESLGFLPGDLKEKIDPYLNPLYDSLRFLLNENKILKYLKNKSIEVAPLAYMRGRTLDNAYIILDEAQNATLMQMKMFLTRLGVGSRAIITGDITQIDLKKSSESGLVQVLDILKEVEGIGFSMLNAQEIVRHPLVMEIIKAYDTQIVNS